MNNRFRRLRASNAIRQLVRETDLQKNNLVQPFFVIDGKNRIEPISTMPGISRFTTDKLLKEIEGYIKAGGTSGLFFGISEKKDLKGSFATSDQGIIPRAVRAVKKNFPDFCVITDVCLCAYLTHGHCGVLKGKRVDNDATLPVLEKMALAHARAGADIVAPSDMMDFRVRHIRETLDRNHFENIAILSYAVKYASAFYGPFREAAQCAPEFGDRKTYQMDYANSREALKEARQDISEGADILMVKPATTYLDIISMLHQHTTSPIAAFHVSGEYAMIKAAARNKWIDEKKAVLETLTSIKRAGADIILTYYAKEALRWL